MYIRELASWLHSYSIIIMFISRLVNITIIDWIGELSLNLNGYDDEVKTAAC
jgi:hypothetical protein